MDKELTRLNNMSPVANAVGLGTKINAIITALNQMSTNFAATGIINACTLSTGSTAEQVATTAFQYRILGMPAVKAAVAAGTAFSAADTINTGAATGDFFGGWAFQINAAGTISSKSPSSDQVYTTAAAALAAAQALEADAGNVIFGYVVVGANTDSSWTANTDDLTAESDCASVSYTSVASDLPSSVTAFTS